MTSVAMAFDKPVRTLATNEGAIKEYKWPFKEQLIGVEVEFELGRDEDTPLPNISGWSRHVDGSLQYGSEYVLREPLAGRDLDRAIHNFFSAGLNLRKSTTSSTHVHVDMTEASTTVDHMKNLIALVYVLEPGIFNAVDPSRQWCGYTNALESANVADITNMLSKSPNRFAGTVRDIGSRYYGINLQALSKFGSVEFRYFPTATSADELASWIILAQSFEAAALSFSSVEQVFDLLMDEREYVDLLDRFFPEWKDSFLEAVSPNRARRRAKTLKSKSMLDGYKVIPSMSRYSNLTKILSGGRYKKIIDITIPDSSEEGGISIYTDENTGCTGYQRGNVVVFFIDGNGGEIPRPSTGEGNVYFLLTLNDVYMLDYRDSGGGSPGNWTHPSTFRPRQGVDPMPLVTLEEACELTRDVLSTYALGHNKPSVEDVDSTFRTYISHLAINMRQADSLASSRWTLNGFRDIFNIFNNTNPSL